MDALMQEKESDRNIIIHIYTEYCDLSTNQQSCPLHDKCLKAHAENNSSLRRYPFTADNI